MPKQWIDVKPNSDLEEALGYKFQNPTLLRQALTHPSAIHENHPKAFDRDLTSLAFVGDAVLKYAVARYLFLNGLNNVTGSRAEMHEGAQRVISNNVLAAIAQEKLHIEEYLMRGNALENLSMNMYADCMEAILGAIALDCGTDQQENVFRVVEKLCADRIQSSLVPTIGVRVASATNEFTIDWPKSTLQLMVHNHQSTLERHERSCLQRLGRICWWIFAGLGVAVCCVILIALIEILPDVKSKRSLLEF